VCNFDGKFIRKILNGEWIYLKTKDVIKKAGFRFDKTYIYQWKSMWRNILQKRGKHIGDLMDNLDIKVNM
jgi:hypothetical protein